MAPPPILLDQLTGYLALRILLGVVKTLVKNTIFRSLDPRKFFRRKSVRVISALSVVLLIGAVVFGIALPRPAPTAVSAPTCALTPACAHSAPSAPVSTAFSAPTAAQMAALPAADYNAVIPGLLAAGGPVPVSATTYTVSADTAIYGSDHRTPVARFPALNFLKDPTVVVAIQREREWALVLTPARQTLPSKSDGNAAAQSEGWVRTADLNTPIVLSQKIVVSLSAQTLSIVSGDRTDETFNVGVGAANTPTPTGVTGYLQARYLDPRQGQSVYPIQLTSLHSSAADEPYSGEDGGLIGVHYEQTHSGDISHGCVRLPAAAITVVNTLPLGTLITIVT